MPTFVYTAKDKQGQEVEQTTEASSKEALIKSLRDEGLYPTSIKQQRTSAIAKKSGKSFSFSFGKRVGLKDLAIFCRQFSTMINAGVSLVRCLDVLEQQSSSVGLKEIIRDIQSEVEGGATLSKSMSKFPRVFSELAVGLARAGEVGGVLDDTLERLAVFLEKDLELRQKIKAAMTYPILVLLVAIGIVTFLVVWILPKFMQLFLDLGMERSDFPAPTRFLMDVSHFMIQKWYIMLLIVVGLWIAIGRIKATKTGKRLWDTMALKIPVFGSLTHKIAVARFARTLSTLLASGVPILQAMETVAGTVANDIMADAVLLSRASIREGDTIADPLAESKMFPPMVVQMITIGEETGQLDSMLEKVADFYDREVDTAVESLTAAIEPIMIVVLGFIVGFIVISMFLPLIGIISNLSQ
ncbi:MAG: type II secretion system F family protein [Armatimonadota bacterium]|nr:type II secretion system F family protein [Armatimonadota bacterium]